MYVSSTSGSSVNSRTIETVKKSHRTIGIQNTNNDDDNISAANLGIVDPEDVPEEPTFSFSRGSF